MRACLLLAGLYGATAVADVTMHVTHESDTHGESAPAVLYLQGGQVKADPLAEDTTGTVGQDGESALVRLSGPRPGVMRIDHDARRVDALATLPPMNADRLQRASGPANPYAFQVVPSGETRVMHGRDAREFNFNFRGKVDALTVLGTLPTYLANLATINVRITGTSWVAPEARGSADVTWFLEQLGGRQWTLTPQALRNPTVSALRGLVTPELTTALSGLAARVSREGLPLAVQYTAVLEADAASPIAGAVQGLIDAAGLGEPYAARVEVKHTDTEPVSAEHFYQGGLPEGYTLTTSP